jgi:hypothetical protein
MNTEIEQGQLALAIEDAKHPAPDFWVVRCRFTGQGRGRGWKILKRFFLTEIAAVQFAENLSPYYSHRCVFKLPG